MANREDILQEKTFKDQCETVEQRVYYTLTDKTGIQEHRVAKALSLVIARLHEKDLLSDTDLDDLLFQLLG